MNTILYPLVLKSSFPAFENTQNKITIPFSLPNFLEYDLVTQAKVYYSLRKLNTNKSVLKNNADSLECYSISINNELKQGEAVISSDNNINGWEIGEIYKFQLRYIINDTNKQSEWSTVCYLKATGAVTLNIIIPNIIEKNDEATLYIDSPIVYGNYENEDSSEIEAMYRFEVFNSFLQLVETSDWKTHLSYENDNYAFTTSLNNLEKYIIKYSIRTKNNYEKTVSKSFNTMLEVLDNLEEIDIISTMNQEEGYIQVDIKSTDNGEKIFGNILLRRTDNKSNFSVWEDYQYFSISNKLLNISFKDFLVESGTTYRYGIQLVSNSGYRSRMLCQNEHNEITAHYDHLFLLGMDEDEQKQLKIKFNPKISSFKRQLQEAKVETIGSKYPFITRNGNINYFTFPIAGLISYFSDEEDLFLSNKKEKFYGVDNIDKYQIGNFKNRFFFDNEINPSQTNIASERFFREKVEQFLTNGNYKIFKSPTEGIKIISLLNISLSPVEALGRMLYSFSSTANEMADFNLTNVINHNIIEVKPFTIISNIIINLKEGIIETSEIEDVYSLIKNRDAEYGELQYLSSIKVEGSGEISISFDGSNFTNDIIVHDIFELNNLVDIKGLKNKTGKKLQITYTGAYKEVIAEKLNNPMDVTTGFYQLLLESNMFETSNNLNIDIFKLIANKIGIERILNFKFARIEVKGGQAPLAFYINDSLEPFYIDAKTSSIQFNSKIESMRVQIENEIPQDSMVLAYITVMYTGLVE